MAVSDDASGGCRRHSARGQSCVYFVASGEIAMEKLDLKKKWKDLYQPRPGVLAEVDVPPLSYLMVDGEGDPNTSAAFQQAVEALYSLAYTLKFSLKKSPKPVDYGVMPSGSVRIT
jgi:hypothetical protein